MCRRFMDDREPGLQRLVPPVSSPHRDIWLVIYRGLQHNVRVRAVLSSVSSQRRAWVV